ncbi:MAG: cupin domain-containing protein [Planctomycetia bacterium]
MKDTEVEFERFVGDLTIPPFGLKLRFLDRGEGSESGVVCLRPRVAGPPVHTHARQDERFVVTAGTLGVLVGKEWRELKPGESVDVPRGTPHTYRNASASVCEFEYRLTPGGRFTRMMREFADLAAEGKLRSLADLRSMIHLAMVFVRYSDEVRSVQPPMFVMRCLACVGRWLGCRLSTSAGDGVESADAQRT